MKTVVITQGRVFCDDGSEYQIENAQVKIPLDHDWGEGVENRCLIMQLCEFSSRVQWAPVWVIGSLRGEEYA